MTTAVAEDDAVESDKPAAAGASGMFRVAITLTLPPVTLSDK
jgi:hypothetical protein